MMKRLWLLMLVWPQLLLWPLLSWADDSTVMSWLDNRFRVDPTVQQVSFMVTRDQKSNSVVLVRPDGHKYYAWRHPESVSWYEEAGMDIISIENPMPGPWQAVGKVSPKNHITVLSDLKLDVDNLPARLYQSETIKFTARLTQAGQPLALRDFLDRVNLSVVFYEYIENPDDLPKEALPMPIPMGTFADDGYGFDEVAGDGEFTVALPIELQPGKYTVKISSGNGIFLRTVEQEVLVYPPPINASFIQGRGQTEDHQVVVAGEEGTLKTGSLAAHIEQVSFEGETSISQQAALPDEETLTVWLPNGELPGRYTWSGWIYATDNFSNRELIFQIPESHFAIQAELQLDRNLATFREQQEAKERQIEFARLDAERQAARARAMKIIALANVLVIVLIVVVAVLWRKRKVKKAMESAEISVPSS
ncbi:TIGR03503 family protein [Photobacterium sp. ZSDE20]|uniref:TIGR03503 family protein n=1 Tax=Photobacterium pectinilyticum TaxID=2906793 RepID=A0ABT1N6W9_9GAMM|nr:TIGR03503 family protein [Photobacterium sp. ZSDE20]MCQ1059441.1 TIGR03503 family protein [Photobacterium sp. ZSDE20]MDD1825127.1 TIGR03503 family protein [Photobacterium sp. ZSDE20]